MKRLALGLAALFAALASAPASAQYSALLVFGDSLVDTGNAQIGAAAYGLDDPAPASEGYFNGRFSNGRNFADYLSERYFGTGVLSNPFLGAGSGLNFAVGGAEAAPDPFLPSPPFPPRTSFDAQLDFFDLVPGPVPDDALAIVTFGGNDVRSVILDPTPQTFAQTLQGFVDGLKRLTDAGVKNILVTGVPDIGALPITRAAGALLAAVDPTLVQRATDRTIQLNAGIEAAAAAEAIASGANISFFDLYGLEQSIRANPAFYGLPSLTDVPCQSGGPAAVLGGCAGYIYFDPIHPTSRMHEVIAAQIAWQLSVPEPQTWAMLIVGFAAVGALARRKRMVAVAFA